MSVLELPQPANWRSGRRHLVLLSLACLAFMTFWIVSGVLATMRGSYLTTYVVFSIAAAPVLVAVAVARAMNGRVTARLTSDTTGLTLWPDRLFQVLCYTALAVVVPSAVTGAIYAPRGKLDLDLSRGWELIYMPAMLTALAVTALGALLAVVRRGGVGYVKLTPGMIENANAIRTRAVEWEDIVDIADSSGEKDFRRAAILQLKDGTEEVISGLDFYVPKGGSVYWMLRHYWRHPEDRMELVDERALDRLHQGRFEVA